MRTKARNYLDRILGRDEEKYRESRFTPVRYRRFNRDYDEYNPYEREFWNENFTSERENRGRFFGKGPKGWKRSDERIKDDVSEALYRDYEVDASGIEVEVKDGVVTLSGTVDDRQTKRAAEECIENLSGVADIHNRLRIGGRENISNFRGNQDTNEKRALS